MSDDEYLFVVDYQEETERKRVEYLFNNWDEGDIARPEGVTRVAAGVDHRELYRQLLNKVPEDQVDAYRLSSVDADVSPETVTIERTVTAPRAPVESFLEYVLSKRKAVLQSDARNEYKLYSKKGRAEVRYTLDSDGTGTSVRLRITGYQPAPSFLGDFFAEELDEFSASQQ